MIASLASTTFDLEGNVILRMAERSTVFAQSRRVTRSKTLDGGVSLSDLGFSHGDRTMIVKSKISSKAEYEAVQYLFSNYPTLILSIDEGAFLGSISGIDLRNDELLITFLPTEKLTS
jgi:hypothetical protein